MKKNGTSLNAELAKMKIKMKISDNKDLVDSENIGNFEINSIMSLVGSTTNDF